MPSNSRDYELIKMQEAYIRGAKGTTLRKIFFAGVIDPDVVESESDEVESEQYDVVEPEYGIDRSRHRGRRWSRARGRGG